LPYQASAKNHFIWSAIKLFEFFLFGSVFIVVFTCLYAFYGKILFGLPQKEIYKLYQVKKRELLNLKTYS